ncbi:Dynamin family protein [Lasiodiplodia theobromae]|uniref:Dynamin family protein n=1 Tax=Lasiodiplodia theobromae TaxID=45133 RepID=UPI0015C2E00F|nr:Dynamin family protein [Lasiodiplodia theobromae]KAF4541959.1 Dynamin family protein [Lasiodiplodia theobromae]
MAGGRSTRRAKADQASDPPAGNTTIDGHEQTKQHAAGSSNHSVDAHASAKLDSLQNDGIRSLLNVVDKLRHVGLTGVLSLPQLVVCGDQSSGKSSVLEAITRIPFPRNAMLCTRFATEIVLRREAKRSITAKIIPGDAQSSARSDELSRFEKSITDFSKLPDLISEATTLMERAGSGDSSHLKAFFADMLSITVSGPDSPPLALVDLPGLIHSETKTQSKRDVEFINALVWKYISNPRSIILAVVSAKHDYANQIILQKARGVDPKGFRTLGIITKPDCLEEGSTDEQVWTALAQNKDIQFELGWHMLRNRTQAESISTFEERDIMEKVFFEGRPIYKNMDKKTLGISALCERLSHLLFAHLKSEIPKLNKELNEELVKTSNRLVTLGEQRYRMSDIRAFLMKSSTKYNTILANALSGNYNDDFFRNDTNHVSTSEAVSYTKLRAAIQYHNSQFAKLMLVFGSKYKFKGVPSEVLDIIGNEDNMDIDGELEYLPYAKRLQKSKTHSEAVVWVRGKMQSSRGEELPGSISATVLKELYWEQTANWEIITVKYIEVIAKHVQDFLKSLTQHVMPADVVERILERKISPNAASHKRNAIDELKRMATDNRRAPMTYNHYFTDTIQKLRHQKMMGRAKGIVNSMNFGTYGQSKVDTDVFLKTLEQELVEPDMEKFTAEEALNCLMALYKDKLKNFIAEVTEQVIERHLVAPLLDSPISQVALVKLSEDEARQLAAEPKHVSNERTRLSTIKRSLETGKDAFERALVQFD